MNLRFMVAYLQKIRSDETRGQKSVGVKDDDEKKENIMIEDKK